MSQLWWQMPGPRRFTERIAEYLADGKNVVIGVPVGMPVGLGPALQRLVPGIIRREWQAVRVRPGSQSPPARLMFAKFAPDAASDTLHTPANLVREPGFVGKIIWVEGLGSDNWQAWRQFLVDYEHACRTVSEYRRSVFCVLASGSIADDLPPPSIGLEAVHYRGICDQLDALLYTASVMPEGRLAGLKRRLAITVIAQLAQWDPAVSDRLSREPLRAILCPRDVLVEMARERGWVPPDLPDGWRDGATDRFEGQDSRHVACIACARDERELRHRVWSAQVSVLFPAIEQRRHELLHDLKAYLTVPFRTRDGTVDSLQELELGHIELQLVQLQREGRCDARLLRALPTVSGLKTMRNALAHMQVLTEAEIVI